MILTEIDIFQLLIGLFFSALLSGIFIGLVVKIFKFLF